MTDHRHARHRQPPDLAQRGATPHMLGEFYPVDDIVAVLEDQTTGERVVQALMAGGVPADDIDLIDGAWFIQHGEDLRQERGPLERLGGLLSVEERSHRQEYDTEARAGHWLIAVHAADAETAARVRGVLASHGARRVRHYRQHTIEDLSV